jgi:hypothetical protein
MTNTTTTPTTKEEIISLIIEAMNNLDTEDLIQLNNTYCWRTSDESEVYGNDEEFFSTFFSTNSFEAVRSAHFGDWRFQDNYVQFNGYGNLVSFNSFEVKDLPDLPQNIAEVIYENPDEFSYLDGFEDLEEIINNI